MKDREEKKNEAGECRMELYMQKLKKQYQAIPVPEEGIFRMEQAIRAMKKQNGYKIQRQRRSFWKGAGMTAAAAAVCITVLANSSASVSMAMEKIPVLGVIVKTVTFRDFQVDEEHYQADVNVPQMSAGMRTAVRSCRITWQKSMRTFSPIPISLWKNSSSP